MIKFNFLSLLKSMDVVSTFSGAEVLSGVLRELSDETFEFLETLYVQARSDPAIANIYWPEDLRFVSTHEEMEQYGARYFLPEMDFSPVAWKLSEIMAAYGDGTFSQKLQAMFLSEIDPLVKARAQSVVLRENREFRVFAVAEEAEDLALFMDWANGMMGHILQVVDTELGLTAD